MYNLFLRLPYWQRVLLCSLPFLVLTSRAEAACSTGDVGGTVYREFPVNGATANTYGVRNVNEPGLAGIQVKVVDASGATQTATTASDGAWSVTAPTFPVRVEFNWSATWLHSSPVDTGSQSSVQFIGASRCDANFGLHEPNDYSQPNPQVATSIFRIGVQTDPAVVGKAGLVEFAYLSGANGRDFDVSTSSAELVEEVTDIAISAPPSSAGTGNAMSPTAGASKIVTATADQIGSVLGLAYHRQSNTLLASAYMKRFSGFVGGPDNTKLGTIYAIDRRTSPNTLSSFYVANAGLDSHDYTNNALNAPEGDLVAANNVGKAGWGDIDLSSNGKTLYAVNLYDRKLYAIPVQASGSSVTSGTAVQINFPTAATTSYCANGDWAPGGVKVHQGDVYVTVTCTAETSQNPDDIKFAVYKFAEADSTSFSLVTTLGRYERKNDWTGVFENLWYPWTTAEYLTGIAGDSSIQRWIHPQAQAMDIEFDEFGKLYLGIRNRSADMRPSFNVDGWPAYEFGDTMVGMPDGDGTYTMLADSNPPVYEFIDDDTTQTAEHPDNDMGLITILKGSNELMVPASVGNSIIGVRTYDSVDGTTTANKSAQPIRYYGLDRTPRDSAVGNPFGKVAGLGDVEIMAMPASVQIGNRVWLDTNANGLQDADETGIDDVSVRLTCGADSVTATTANGGQYLFSNTSGANATFMDAGESCTLRLDLSQSALSGYTLTAANNNGDSSNNGQTDVLDSDAVEAAGQADIAFTVGDAGNNNHSFDIGFKTVPTITAECNAGNGDFGGFVFRDYNANGLRDLLEPGVRNVTVTAYNAAGQAVGSANTSGSGSYSLMGLTVGTEYRLEFTGLPTMIQSGMRGTESKTSVRFETAAARCDVNFGVNNPAQYCQATPEIATSRFAIGDVLVGANSDKPALLSINAGWGQRALGTDSPPHTSDKAFWQPADKKPRTISLANKVGAIYGIGWDNKTNYLYAATYHKNQAGYGPGGRGQIYRVKMNPTTGEPDGEPELWVNVETDLGLTVCGDHGVDLTDQYDQVIFDQVGKCSLGDLELSEDGQTVYVMNLATKEVVGIDVATKAMTGKWEFPINQPSCNNAPTDVRPFALGFRDGMVYAGAVCSAQTSRNKAHLRAYVQALNPTSGVWATILEYDWSKQRRGIYGSQLDPWLSSIDQVYGGRFATGTPRNWVTDNSQMLTDIVFVGNDMTLGFRGRFSDQWGVDILYGRATPTPAVTSAMYTANTVGDVVCVSYDATTDTYNWETNDHVNNLGVCGSRVASHPGYVHPQTNQDITNTNAVYHDDNLDDGEFYWGDGGAPLFGTNARHYEISLGGLAQYGTEPLIMGALTAPNALGVGYDQSSGFVWSNNSNGEPLQAYVMYDQADLGSFNKASGLGDIEALCLPAPLEVGNRVWIDANKNGIQDPAEAGVDGVNVTLACGANQASTVTANGGEYYFSTIEGGNASFMTTGENCVLEIDNTQAPLQAYQLTTVNADGDTSNVATTDLRDSDGVEQTTKAVVKFVVGNAGENNHTFDFGYASNPLPDLRFQKTVLPTSAKPGQTVEYTLMVTNEGAANATGVTINEQLPSHLVFVSADVLGYDANSGIWTVGDLSINETKTLKLTVRIKTVVELGN